MIREADLLQNGLFLKSSEGGGVIFNPKIYIADFCHFIDDTSVMNFGKNLQYDFPKMRGGGQMPFGSFPKIHPFWRCGASLTVILIVTVTMIIPKQH